jgi:hypothetical protein
MPTVYLKNGDSVEVKQEELEDYLHKNQDKIATRYVQRRGLKRCKSVPVDNASFNSK